MKTAILIPARMDSKRLPGKPLLDLGGKPLMVRTYEAAKQSKLADYVAIVTPDRKIAAGCEEHKCNFIWRLENDPFISGTQRVADAALDVQPAGSALENVQIVVNLQVDEPFVTGEMLDKLIEKILAQVMQQSQAHSIGTLVGKTTNNSDLTDSNLVKVVADEHQCHWFSRSPISTLIHVGCYGYQIEELKLISQLPRGEYATLENLEQLDWICHGWHIAPVYLDEVPPSINTSDELWRAREGFTTLHAAE